MTPRERMVVIVTLCITLVLAVGGIIALMWRGVNVAAPVSLAVTAQWGALLLAVTRKE
jgi:hypothetical protein